MITLYEYNGFNDKLMHDLRLLIDACQKVDGYEPMIYWDVLKFPRNIPGDYCLYGQNKMIGYLSTFYFEENIIEISFVIHPDFRNQSLFEDLLDYARKQLQHLHYEALLLSTDENDPQLPKTFLHLGAKTIHKEYTLLRNTNEPEEIYAADHIELFTARSAEDINNLAHVHNQCFNSDAESMIERFTQTSKQPNRCCFLAMYKGEVIGAIHARNDSDGSTFLHDVSIIPEKQNLGFGIQLLKLAINALLTENVRCFKLIVATNNPKALRLYQRCHFEIKQTYQFWRINKQFTFPPHYSIPETWH